MKVAIVYDWIDKWGGVERVLLELAKMFPKADFYTSYYDEKNATWAMGLNIKTTFLQSFPDFIKKNRVLSFPFYPYAFESLDFREYDIVISITSSFAKGIITHPHALHISYVLTPPRYLWSHRDAYLKHNFGKKIADRYQRWDNIAAQRPDRIVSISQTIQKRVEKYYGRKSSVIYPPFDTHYWEKMRKQSSVILNKVKDSVGFFANAQNDNSFFLVVSRLEPYKRIDMAIETFNERKETLVIIGKGSQLGKLKRMSGRNAIFLQDLSDKELALFYSHAQALIMPQEEDFGYVALEAQYFGCPVIAFAHGGALETVLENKTGIFFEEQTHESLARAVERYHTMSYNLRESTKKYGPPHAERFSKKSFEKKFMDMIMLQVAQQKNI